MSKKNILPGNTIIEVVMTKEMTYTEYLKTKENAQKKGWQVQSFQIGFRSKKLSK